MEADDDRYLYKKRTIVLIRCEKFITVFLAVLFVTKQSGIEHGRIAQFGTMSTTENAPGLLGLVDHRRDDEPGRSQGLLEKIVAGQFLRGVGHTSSQNRQKGSA